MIYLDYSANTPIDPAALETYMNTEREFFANPNSSHAAGQAARERLALVTQGIAESLGILPSEIIFTSGATEANNLAVKSLAQAQSSLGKHIITTPLEHASVAAPLDRLRRRGYEVEYACLATDGKIELDALKKQLRADTVLVAVTAVDSELGIVQPIGEIAGILRDYPNCRLHADATQAIGKIPFSFAGLDTVSFTAHKFYGPNGIGILYKRGGVELEPLIHGGLGASPYRGGTPTLALAAALDTALELALNAREARYERVAGLSGTLRRALEAYPIVRFNSPVDAVPHILNLSVSGVKATRFQRALSERGVCVSVKSACSSDGEPSEAVLALTGERKNALSSWRISISHLTTEREIEEFIGIFDLCQKELTK